MNHQSYFRIAGTVFTIVALAHLWRIATGTIVIFGNYQLPMWFSWVGVVVAGYLAYQGLKRK